MSTTYKLIEKVTVTSGVSSVNLGTGNTIPQTYTDLLVLCTVRSSTNADPSFYWSYNGDGSAIYSARFLRGTGSATSSFSQSSVGFHRSDGGATGTGETADTFSSVEILIADYTGSSSKSASLSMVSENNAATADMTCGATLYASSNPITLINLSVDGTLAVGSTFYLYGVSRVAPNVVATGGTVTTVGGYRYHTFTSSGSFVVSEPGTVEYIIIGGGGGGGFDGAGGGGAGGFLTGTALTTAQTYSVTVGGGGAYATSVGSQASAGSGSSALSLSGSGGGGGGSKAANGANGASGGGGGHDSVTRNGGSGTGGQGYAGGRNSTNAGGGGGGAGAVGANAGSGLGGAGGAGQTYSIWATATNTGVSGAYAGGGGGGSWSGTGGAASGGGGSGGSNTTVVPTSGSANSGGGGGGHGAATAGNPGSGGSGIVIIRYPVNE